MDKRRAKELVKRAAAAMPRPLQLLAAEKWCEFKKRRLKRRTTPEVLIFFATNRCNLRCSHCFYWRRLNTGAREMRPEEIRTMAASFRGPLSLSITGGEPFLRSDVPELAACFENNCSLRELGFATNGFSAGKITRDLTEILNRHPHLPVSVQLSMDGLEKTHDRIRGVPGAFDRAMKTLDALKDLSRQYPRLSFRVGLAVQRQNVDELEDFVRKLAPIASLGFNIVRGGSFGLFSLPVSVRTDTDPQSSHEIHVPVERLERVFSLLTRLDGELGFWDVRQRRVWEASLFMLKTQKPYVPCHARYLEAVLYPEGEVAFCELSRPFANIRDFGLDFSALWTSGAANEMRPKVSRCYCIHGCNLTTSLGFDPAAFVSSMNLQVEKGRRKAGAKTIRPRGEQ